jgi:hypothetical protein
MPAWNVSFIFAVFKRYCHAYGPFELGEGGIM